MGVNVGGSIDEAEIVKSSSVTGLQGENGHTRTIEVWNRLRDRITSSVGEDDAAI